MTAMMAFFLLMWLLAQAPEQKKAVSDYFSTPSVIEYNFSNYGVELTLEKLFLDLINEPLKVLQDFMQPADYTPNFLQMGSKNIIMSTLSEELGAYAEGFEVQGDTIELKFPEGKLFEDGSAEPRGQFGTIMERLAKFTAGLEDADVYVDSRLYLNSVKGQNRELGERVAEKRLDLILSQIDRKLEHQSVSLHSKAEVKPGTRRADGRPEEGYIRIQIKQKELRSDGSKPRKLGSVLGKDDESMDVYNNFVNKMTTRKPSSANKSGEN
ncbi:MAG: chemotaxis protein MotB [Calothrix sp. SM1_5_4]|nr:chemotaxis protein MotB [Calothrix sp. SM1_5_4]